MQNSTLPGPFTHPAADTLARSVDQLQFRVRSAQRTQGADTNAELKNAASEFESLFVGYLLKVMRETIEPSGKEEGLGKGIYTELFDQELSRNIARHGALGIADLLVQRLSREETSPESKQITGLPRSDSALHECAADESSAAGGGAIPDFRLPVKAAVSSEFGLRKDPFTRRVRFHNGIDLAAPEGMDVRAALSGKVIFSGHQGDYGTTVVIAHPGDFQTRYAHLRASYVKTGDFIEAQQVLGVVGSTGRATGPHLHFEISRGGEQIDPKMTRAD